MTRNNVGLAILALSGFMGTACGDPGPCDAGQGVRSVDEILASSADHACIDWLSAVHTRVGRVNRLGSAAVWSRRTQHGTGLVVTAGHVSSRCAQEGRWKRDASGSAVCPENLARPAFVVPGEPFQLGATGGGQPKDRLVVPAHIYNPRVTEEDFYGALGKPRYDFSVYGVDDQDLPVWGRASALAPFRDAPFVFDDPGQRTLEDPTWAAAEPHSEVMLVGFPPQGDGRIVPEVAFSVLRVLDDREAKSAISRLEAAGDEEGSIPYDPEAEFIAEGQAMHGMSGGPAFDVEGHLLGVAVRASFEGGLRYVRIVRMSYIVDRLEAALCALSPEERATVGPYLEPPRSKCEGE